MIYAVINKYNVVDNVVVWDGSDDWSPEDGFYSVEANENCRIGSIYQDGEFLPPKEDSLSGS